MLRGIAPTTTPSPGHVWPLDLRASIKLVSGEMSVLLLTGNIAAGKTVVGREIGELLAPTVAHAIVDLDELGRVFIPGAPSRSILKLRISNLAAIWPNLRSAGIRYVVVAAAITSTDELELIRGATGSSQLAVVRLMTPPSLLESRLRERDSGRLLHAHMEAMPTLEHRLNEANVEDFRVVNDEHPPEEVANKVLQTIGWTSSPERDGT